MAIIPIDFKNNKYFIISKIILLASFPLVILATPIDYFDEGQIVCISRLLLDKECPGCGITRAMMHLSHFDYKSALYFNKLSFIVLPLLIYLYITMLIKEIKALKKIRSNKS
jgi:hypothetical protein